MTAQRHALSSEITQESVNAVDPAGMAQDLVGPEVATIHVLHLSQSICALTFPASVDGRSFTLVLVQDATGGRQVMWDSSVRWQGGVAPVLTTTANKTDVFSFLATSGLWLGFVAGQNY